MSDRSAFDSQNIHDAHNIHDSQNTKMVRVSMTKRVCQIGAVSCAVLLGSCAMMTPSRVDDDRLVRLPEDSRAAILKREQAVNVATSNLRAIRTGRANPMIVERVMVNYYDTPTPLTNLATIAAPEPQLLTIRPFDARA